MPDHDSPNPFANPEKEADITESPRKRRGFAFSESDRRLLRWMAPYFKPYWRGYLTGAACGVGNSASQNLLLLAIKPAAQAAADGNLKELPLFLGAIFAITLIKSAFIFGQEFLIYSSGFKVAMDARNAVYAHLQTLSLKYFHRTSAGQLMSRLTNDVRVIEDGITMNATSAITGPFNILFGVAGLLYLSWRLSLLSFILIPIVVFILQRGSLPMRRAAQQKQSRQAGLATVLEETITGVRVVQSFGGEAREIARFKKEAKEAFRASMRGVRVIAVMMPTMEIVTILAVIFILALGATEIHSGRLNLAGLMAFVMVLNSVAAAFNSLGRTYTNFQQTLNAFERLREVYNEPPEIVDAPDAMPLPDIRGEIVFEDVAFGYSDEHPILRGIRFRAAPGEMIAFVGSSGAGKTTLANLVPRFYDPQTGRIRIDGVDIRNARLADLRRHIGIVPQETQLFSGTVAENIAYGKPEATGEEIVGAAKAANAHGFIEQLEDGYETVVGERGAKLSGGQRQRIAIARAVLKDPTILILDEATSSLDAESEKLVSEALERLMKGRTTLMIAHRLSTIRRADRILVMEDGEITEEGTEEELLTADGAYARLFKAQFAEEDEAHSTKGASEAPSSSSGNRTA